MAVSVFKTIIQWACSRPMWQREALRRLLEKGDLEDRDYLEFTGMCKAENGFTDLRPPVPIPRPFNDSDIQVQMDNVANVCLIEIKDVQNVNALMPGQSIPFNEIGLTVIYGDNASGKSGYARVLKQVCRARGKSDEIIPNIYKVKNEWFPSASIIYKFGKDRREFIWTDCDLSLPPELGQVSFFDNQCAVIYVTEENDVAFTPFGLDLLPKLSSVCRNVQSRLN